MVEVGTLSTVSLAVEMLEELPPSPLEVGCRYNPLHDPEMLAQKRRTDTWLG